MKPTFAAAETLEKMYQEERFDEAFEFKKQFNWSSEITEVDGKYGLKNCLGEQIVPNDFEDFKLLDIQFLKKTSRVVAQKDGKWGILKTDGSGEWIIAPEYDFISFPNNVFAVEKDGNNGPFYKRVFCSS